MSEAFVEVSLPLRRRRHEQTLLFGIVNSNPSGPRFNRFGELFRSCRGEKGKGGGLKKKGRKELLCSLVT